MKSKISNGMNKYLKTISYLIVSILVGITAVYAGTLTPPGAPAKTMKSLSDLYELINTGANTPSTDFTTPAYNPSQGTMHSLGDTYDLIKSQLDILTADKIAKDEEVFGRTGTLYGDTDPSQVLTTADYPGTATAGTTAFTFALADATTYSCEALAVDPAQQAVTLETICEYHTGDGCSWSGSACVGGVKTPAGGYMTWHAGTASCSEKIDEGSTSWRLLSYPELVGHYLDHNNAGGPPTGFVGGGYWSGTTYPNYSGGAYSVSMGSGLAGSGSKDSPNYLVHCAH